MGRLGETLKQARRARGISLEEAERDTRIVRSYLRALEQEEFTALPQPTVARGLLGLYARYLGLDPGEMLVYYPLEGDEPPPPPKPGAAPAPFRLRRLSLGGLFLLLFVGILLLYWLGADGGGREDLPATGGAVLPAIPGTVPDLRGVEGGLAQRALQELRTDYAILEVAIPRTPPGIVYQQNPPPGTKLRSGLTVTLLVSRSPPPAD